MSEKTIKELVDAARAVAQGHRTGLPSVIGTQLLAQATKAGAPEDPDAGRRFVNALSRSLADGWLSARTAACMLDVTVEEVHALCHHHDEDILVDS
ncbi:conserved protein of unknown function [Rhodovastum atsumiense]|uniref:Uncharacterized protein n=1 Tax=Rhodovastum atsumiense TaxID=504468 RepID=A0A5M6IWK1_9PROT|nr:hypothetical protein [Rhodovastum atsumiense]KAA5612693.1 hypothetical protein F1189_08110 [Rhodovastum atsumiense]CAH2602758.1 conserved protein of unknown function [Rhodovastum atsumiense]